MFLASPPQPHSSRLLHFFLQDLYSLLEIPVNYSCFCIMQNDLTCFLVYTSPNSSILRSKPYLSQPSRDDRWMNEFKFNEMPDRQLKTPDYTEEAPACSTKWIMPRGGDCSGHGLRSHIWGQGDECLCPRRKEWTLLQTQLWEKILLFNDVPSCWMLVSWDKNSEKTACKHSWQQNPDSQGLVSKWRWNGKGSKYVWAAVFLHESFSKLVGILRKRTVYL